jgi:hypothetical protein
MPVKTNAELDAYFNTGDQPSESNFQDLIDTIQPPLVTLTETTGTVNFTTADHGFRQVVVPDLTGTMTINLPSSFTALYDWFHIVYLGDGTDADDNNLVIKTGTQDSQFFSGNIIHNTDIQNDNSDDAVDNTFNDLIQANGTNHDILTCTTISHLDLWFQAKSSTVWYVWGNTFSPTINDVVWSAS